MQTETLAVCGSVGPCVWMPTIQVPRIAYHKVRKQPVVGPEGNLRGDHFREPSSATTYATTSPRHVARGLLIMLRCALLLRCPMPSDRSTSCLNTVSSTRLIFGKLIWSGIPSVKVFGQLPVISSWFPALTIHSSLAMLQARLLARAVVYLHLELLT